MENGIRELFKENNIESTFNLENMLDKGEFEKWAKEQGQTLDSEFIKSLNSIREYANKVRLDEAKENADDGYKQKYDDLKKEYKEYKAGIQQQATEAKKKDAYMNLLTEVGVSEKRRASVMRVADLAGVELDENGKIKNADTLKNSIKEEWADFIEKKSSEGANTPTPPGNGGGQMTKDEILASKDAGERQAAIAENHTLFGF